MNTSNDQLKIKYSETDKQPKSVKLMSLFLILIFAIVPLAEIVTDLDYNTITHYSRHICISGLDYSFDVLSFKEIK